MDHAARSGVRSGLNQLAGVFQMLLQLGQRLLGEGGYLGIIGAGGALEQFDGALMRINLVVGVGIVEGLAVTRFQDHGTGLVHQLGLVGNFPALAGGKFGHLLVGGCVVLDHAFGKRLHFGILRLLQGLLCGLYFSDTQRGGFFQEVFAINAVTVGVSAGHAAVNLIIVADGTGGV